MASQTRPEPMNASPHHPKVKVTLSLGTPLSVAGTFVAGKMEMECKADKGLGINIMMVELFGIQELTSRDHSATSTFLHSRRLYQGPGLPPSNAVQPYPMPGDPPLPAHHHQARRGITTFLFRFPIPSSSPSALNFGAGLARVRYEVKASVEVSWKDEKRLVTDKKEVDIVEAFEEDFGRMEPEGVVVGENGKIWVQGRVVGGVIVAGESACIELQVKNHSSKKNTGLSVALTRALYMPKFTAEGKPPLQITDTLTTVPFRGPEYIIPPGAEGVASLVFDVPKRARGVRGGTRENEERGAPPTDALFEVRCMVEVKIAMGIGSKDIQLNLPVTVVHPAAIPELPAPAPYGAYIYPSPPPDPVGLPPPAISPLPYLNGASSPYAYPPLPMSPPIHAAVAQGHVWLPPPQSYTPNPYQYFSPPIQGQQYYFPPPPVMPANAPPPRPVSAGPSGAHAFPVGAVPVPLPGPIAPPVIEPEEGKGERASRITHHLRLSSRHRSVSPQSHRFPLPSNPVPIPQPAARTLPPPPITTHNLAPSNNLLAAGSPSSPQSVVHSPRPLLSPKHSYSADPAAPRSLPKSERVEELEKMAAAVDARQRDLSGDVSPAALEPAPLPAAADINKTLPGPPVPTTKDAHLAPPPAARPRADDVFAGLDPAPADAAPPTPTLTATRHARRLLSPGGATPAPPPSGLGLGISSLDPGAGGGESGLDALERRLLAEVGTRKAPTVRRPDVRAVLPITIPPAGAVEPADDSAISSLTLADREGWPGAREEHEAEGEWRGEAEHDSDERTHRAGKSKSSTSGDDRAGRSTGRGKGKAREAGRTRKVSGAEDEPRERRKKPKEGKSRKAAHGRVAAWLGALDPEIPPPEVPPSPAPASSEPSRAPSPAKAADVSDPAPSTPAASAPNPRSSGFVPIGTLRRETLARPHAREPSLGGVADEAQKVADIWSAPSSSASPAVHPPNPPATPSSSSVATVAAVAGPHTQDTKPPRPPVSKKLAAPSPRLPAFPPPRLDPEVKYDVRSARGGRGGKVTAVASIWAAGAVGAGADAGAKADAKKMAVSPLAKLPTAPLGKKSALLGKTSAPLAKTTVPPLAKTTTPVTKPPTAPLAKPLHPPSLSRALSGSADPAANPNPTPSPKRLDLAGTRARPVVKAPSVPAVISSSHATPMLSSTASLARPSPAPGMLKAAVRLPPTISETPSGLHGKTRPTAATGAGAGKPVDLAFGQAKLRDLIKKYQGQT